MDPVANPEVTPVAGGEPLVPAGDPVAVWKTEIPQSLRDNEAFAPYKTKDELWNGHIEAVNKIKDLEGRLGNSIPKLPDNATDEQKAAYKAAMGIPDKADDYEIPVPEGDSPELANELRQAAFTKGWPKGVVKEITEWWNGMQAKMVQNYVNELKTHTEAVKAKWGADFDKNAEIVKNVFTAFKDKGGNDIATIEVIGPDGKKMLLGNHPAIQEFFLTFGKEILPDGGIRGGQAVTKPVGPPTRMTYS